MRDNKLRKTAYRGQFLKGPVSSTFNVASNIPVDWFQDLNQFLFHKSSQMKDLCRIYRLLSVPMTCYYSKPLHRWTQVYWPMSVFNQRLIFISLKQLTTCTTVNCQCKLLNTTYVWQILSLWCNPFVWCNQFFTILFCSRFFNMLTASNRNKCITHNNSKMIGLSTPNLSDLNSKAYHTQSMYHCTGPQAPSQPILHTAPIQSQIQIPGLEMSTLW